ncbi:MAG: hypothetical protein CBB68_13795 [Rhodospirillaceae bacterium TMED8]|nr:hypothetical protein [Magnetovibrio sp.]OUT48312.1 MAG: hypothetical protein CBB68_13795 [Rhodospirillaceae bacterium TMED8]
MLEQSFRDEHEFFGASLKKNFKMKITPYHSLWEQIGQVSRDVWLAASELGFLGCSVPEKYGARCRMPAFRHFTRGNGS